MKKKDFFTQLDEKKIITAIEQAEDKTSGEIRVHVEPECPGDDPFPRALMVFKELEMHQTKLRNGVLFYLAFESHKFAVVADEGINSVVPDNFWDGIKDKIIAQFKDGNFAEGLEEGILETGKQLKRFFPHQGNEDKNELPDELSKG